MLLDHEGAFGLGTFTINGGTIDNTSGLVLTNINNNAQNWNANFTFNGTNDLYLGTGAVTLGANVTVTVAGFFSTLGVSGVIGDGAGVFNLTKAGAGTLMLGAGNAYDGATTIGQGTLLIAADQNLSALTNTLIFGATAGSANVGRLTLSGADALFGGAMTVQTSGIIPNSIQVETGDKLQVNGAVTIGYNSSAVTTTVLEVFGGGTFSIGAPGAPTNNNVQIGGNVTTNVSNMATLDMSGLSVFYANLGTGTFRVGDATNSGGGTGTGGGGSTLILAQDSTIIATTITSDSPTSAATQAIKLGGGVNEFNATTITIGGSANRAIGTLDFFGSTGSIKIRNLAGDGRAALNIQNGSSSTAADLVGTVNFAGHQADLLLGTVVVGGRSAQTTGDGTGTFTFDTGILDATTISIGARSGSGATTGNVTGTFNLGGTTAGTSAVIGTLTVGTNSASTAETSGDSFSTVNISGIGTNTIGSMTMATITVAGATNVAGADALATLNVAGGNTTIGTLTMRATIRQSPPSTERTPRLRSSISAAEPSA
ncbi:MAG: autotransporter-associated beta strand repeat-containing protein [Pirellulales bacterium]